MRFLSSGSFKGTWEVVACLLCLIAFVPPSKAALSSDRPSFAVVTVIEDLGDIGRVFGAVALGGSLRRFRAVGSSVALMALTRNGTASISNLEDRGKMLERAGWRVVPVVGASATKANAWRLGPEGLVDDARTTPLFERVLLLDNTILVKNGLVATRKRMPMTAALESWDNGDSAAPYSTGHEQLLALFHETVRLKIDFAAAMDFESDEWRGESSSYIGNDEDVSDENNGSFFFEDRERIVELGTWLQIKRVDDRLDLSVLLLRPCLDTFRSFAAWIGPSTEHRSGLFAHSVEPFFASRVNSAVAPGLKSAVLNDVVLVVRRSLLWQHLSHQKRVAMSSGNANGVDPGPFPGSRLFLRFAAPAHPWEVAAYEMQQQPLNTSRGDPIYGGSDYDDNQIEWGLGHALYEYHREWRRMFSTGLLDVIPLAANAPCMPSSSVPSSSPMYGVDQPSVTNENISRGIVPRVYFLLTSVPPRAHRLPDILASLRNQTLQPNRVILSLPHTYHYRFNSTSYRLPAIRRLTQKEVEEETCEGQVEDDDNDAERYSSNGYYDDGFLVVRQSEHDLGPVTKYLGTDMVSILQHRFRKEQRVASRTIEKIQGSGTQREKEEEFEEEDEDAIVVVSDDDVQFPPTFVEDFVCGLVENQSPLFRSARLHASRGDGSEAIQTRSGPLVLTGAIDPGFTELGQGLRGVDGVAFWVNHMRWGSHARNEELSEAWAGLGIAQGWASKSVVSDGVRATCLLADDVFATYVAAIVKGGTVRELNLRRPSLPAPSRRTTEFWNHSHRNGNSGHRSSGSDENSPEVNEVAQEIIPGDVDRPLYNEHARAGFLVNTNCMKCLIHGGAHCA